MKQLKHYLMLLTILASIILAPLTAFANSNAASSTPASSTSTSVLKCLWPGNLQRTWVSN